MKVFVAGATGVVGRRAVARLVAAGHEVTGVARSDEKAELLRSLGATPARVDLFDAGAVKEAVAGHDAVVNLTTHIPRVTAAAIPTAWKENDRIRNEVSRNLVDAAVAAGAPRVVQESITFQYADGGDAWIDEDAPIEGRVYASVIEAERNARRATDAVVLRFGAFYDADSHTTRDMIRVARLGRFGLPGAPDAYASFVATDDAAAAVVAALDAPPGTYNVVDDEPMTRAEVAAVLSDAIGRHVQPLPAISAKAAAGATAPLSRSQRVSNARFKAASGWTPSVPSLREGMPEVVREIERREAAVDRSPRLARVLLALLFVPALVMGAWAEFSPQSFYDDFPGLGLVWVSGDGPFNEHLVRDFGALNLALAVVLGAALWTRTRTMALTASAAYAVFAAPHLVYHLRHGDVLDGIQKASSLSSLAFAVVLSLAAAFIVRRGSTDAI